MDLSNLKPSTGSVKKEKRIARGQGSGHGGTSTRGHKGAKSRSGFKNKRHFEGGQMPLQMRLPKRGFNSPNRTVFVPMNFSRLMEISEKYGVTDISFEFLVSVGIVGKTDRVKILANGELSTALNVTAHAASKTSMEQIQQAGGSINIIA
jgi:large subunit ribosomal protein L15